MKTCRDCAYCWDYMAGKDMADSHCICHNLQKNDTCAVREIAAGNNCAGFKPLHADGKREVNWEAARANDALAALRSGNRVIIGNRVFQQGEILEIQDSAKDGFSGFLFRESGKDDFSFTHHIEYV